MAVLALRPRRPPACLSTTHPGIVGQIEESAVRKVDAKLSQLGFHLWADRFHRGLGAHRCLCHVRGDLPAAAEGRGGGRGVARRSRCRNTGAGRRAGGSGHGDLNAWWVCCGDGAASGRVGGWGPGANGSLRQAAGGRWRGRRRHAAGCQQDRAGVIVGLDNVEIMRPEAVAAVSTPGWALDCAECLQASTVLGVVSFFALTTWAMKCSLLCHQLHDSDGSSSVESKGQRPLAERRPGCRGPYMRRHDFAVQMITGDRRRLHSQFCTTRRAQL